VFYVVERCDLTDIKRRLKLNEDSDKRRVSNKHQSLVDAGGSEARVMEAFIRSFTLSSFAYEIIQTYQLEEMMYLYLCRQCCGIQVTSLRKH